MVFVYKTAQDNKETVRRLEEQIKSLEQDSTSSGEQIERLKGELRQVYERKSQGARVRARVRWFEEGETSSRYFHNLEKRNAKDNLWEKILDDDGNIVYGTEDVMRVLCRSTSIRSCILQSTLICPRERSLHQDSPGQCLKKIKIC